MLEILKDEIVHERNFKDIGEYGDVLCPYEHLIWFCEMKCGKEKTWNYIKDLFKGSDRDIQERLIHCCAWRYDRETDHQRRQILIDLACGNVIDKYLINTVILSIPEEFDYIKPTNETYKEILSKLDRTKHEGTFQHISAHIASSELFDKCNASSILHNITANMDWNEYDRVCKFVNANISKKDYKKEDIIVVFKLFLKHDYATDEAKQTIEKLLKEAMLK